MKLNRRLPYAALACVMALTSCAEQGDEDYNKYESMSLQAWVTQRAPQYVSENFLPVGDSGLYFDILDPGRTDVSPIADDDMWVTFDFSGRDLSGNIVLTRNADEAKLLGTFTKYTRYVPYYRYCGSENSGLLEGAYLAMRSKLTMSEHYYEKYKDERGFDSREVLLREGTKVVLYVPSILIGSSGIEGSGGYEGQTSLAAQRPMRITMEIRDTVDNPLRIEGNDVDEFCERNGKTDIYDKTDNPVPTDPTEARHPYNPASKRWVSACDTVAQLYVNYRYDPKTDLFDFPNPYNVGYEPYSNALLDKKIADTLVYRFHKKDKTDYEKYVGVADLDADSVGLDGTAKIWYIGRFLDGFIFDTNIDEVKALLYDKGYTTGSALSYTPSSGGLIQAFYYTVPHLKYGQWAALVTTSTQAYGSSGQSGSTSTSTSSSSTSSSDYYNYLNYVNSYYNGYYGGYYDNYYGNYYNGYYGSYDYSSSGSTSTTTTTVTTEIPSFAPLIFQFYVEPE